MKEFSYNSEVKEIENEIIEFLMQSQLFLGERTSTAEILSYFITRKELTQSKLKKLTNLSRGTISQELQYLTERNIIEEKNSSDKKEKLYIMESIIIGFINSYLYTTKNYTQNKSEFLLMKKQLTQQKEKLQEFEEFDMIYKIVNLFLAVFPLVEKIFELLKKKRDSIIAQKEK